MRFPVVVMAFLAALTLLSPSAISQEPSSGFPEESFTQINPTLPNSRLNFNDDSQESCCAKDYSADGTPVSTPTRAPSQVGSAATKKIAGSEFEKSNPAYTESTIPAFLVTCEALADLPEMAANAQRGASPSGGNLKNPPIVSYSSHKSIRPGASYMTDPRMHNTSDFHIETVGGDGMVQLQDVRNYSVCMGRGGNITIAANTDNGSILTYNGSDHILLSGHNTNMLTRAGAGTDIIEVHQAQAGMTADSGDWTAFNIYKSAISGGADTDTLIIKGTPVGTKWCHIGGYRIYGEYFYVVEFALPPTVTQGPRRQRLNIGESVEYVVIKGKQYRLRDFLSHGAPTDMMAQSDIPIHDPLPWAN